MNMKEYRKYIDNLVGVDGMRYQIEKDDGISEQVSVIVFPDMQSAKKVALLLTETAQLQGMDIVFRVIPEQFEATIH